MPHAHASRGLVHEVLDLLVRDFALFEPLPREDDLRPRALRRLLAVFHRLLRGVLEVHRLVHRAHAVLEVQHLVRAERHGDAIEEVLAERALLGVERRDEQGLARVPEGDTLALHHVLTLGEHGQEEVGHGLVEEVDLVDVEDAAVRLGEEAGLEHRLALLHRSLDVHGAHEAILGDAEGDLHEGSLADAGHELALRIAAELLAKAVLPAVGILRVGVADGAVDDLDGGQERVQTAGHDGLGGTAPARDGDTAQCRIDGAEQKRRLDVLLADDRGERERLAEVALLDGAHGVDRHLFLLHRGRDARGGVGVGRDRGGRGDRLAREGGSRGRARAERARVARDR
mmetsp:Transcript_182127/g.443165  ORF Transcript_182127/g.443165 Transcript_182127/m.443165 type:complete len:343 (-) Transcript_182127:101-1129(-)